MSASGGGGSSGGGGGSGGGSGGGGATTCEYSISSGEETFVSEGGTGSVDIISNGDGCKWTAVSNDNWIEITSASSGRGKSGTVEYSVSANTISKERTGTLTIAGETFDVIQDGDIGAIGRGGDGDDGGGDDDEEEGPDCEYSISSGEEAFASEGGTGSVDMSTEDGCEWTAESNDNWIEITSDSSGSGDGTVEFSVLQNTGVALRTGYITITVDGYTETFTVTQAATVTQTMPVLRIDIKANNSDGPITIWTDENLLIEISLSAADLVGEEADWWVVASTPSGLKSYDLDQGFVPGLLVTYQGAIVDLGTATILNTSGLTDGVYTYYFGIDLEQDGELDTTEGLFYLDSVEVTIEEGGVVGGGGLSTPTGFTVSVDGTTATLSWEAVDGAEGYMLYYGYSSGEYSGAVDLDNSTGRVFENVPEDTYYVVITAYAGTEESGYPESNYSEEVSATVSCLNCLK